MSTRSFVFFCPAHKAGRTSGCCRYALMVVRPSAPFGASRYDIEGRSQKTLWSSLIKPLQALLAEVCGVKYTQPQNATNVSRRQ